MRDYRLSKAECERIAKALIDLNYVPNRWAGSLADDLYDQEIELDSGSVESGPKRKVRIVDVKIAVEVGDDSTIGHATDAVNEVLREQMHDEHIVDYCIEETSEPREVENKVEPLWGCS